ncbi:MAG: DUF3800 domain-containing protein [Flavobacteriaceae bacterium]
MRTLKWYADNSELSSVKGETDVLLFGGVILDELTSNKIKELMIKIKSQYTYPTMPIKWNMKDLKDTYVEMSRVGEFKKLLNNSSKWRTMFFEELDSLDFKILVSVVKKFSSTKKLTKVKEDLINISFSQALMRLGLFANENYNDYDKFEVILDWPESSNPKPFNREYFRAFNFGKSNYDIEYYSGPLDNLKFNDSIYFVKSTHSVNLQFADLVIGSAKDFLLKCIDGRKSSLGYDLTKKILHKYRGYPHDILTNGLVMLPKEDPLIHKVSQHIKNIII